MKNINLTYFTPTYNRAKLLPKLYKSLINQTNKNFIWLIVDDGSKDDTETIVNKWKNENKINIEYVKKENGGKHTAIDLSNQICTTEFITCIDSDDYITENCTECLEKYMANIRQKNNVVGIVGRRDLIGYTRHKEANWPQNQVLLYFHELSENYNFNFDTILVFKTSIIKNYSFPKFNDERFVTESVFYNKFMFDYKMMAIEEFLYIGEYQDDGYTNMGMNLFIKNPKGFACHLKQDLYLKIKNKKSLKKKLKASLYYYGWKAFFKLKEDFMTEYKIPWFYKFVGILASPLSKLKLKKKYRI